MKATKIVYLLGSLNRGGTETLMLDVFRHAKRCGLEAVCFYRKGGVCEDDFQQSGVPMVYIPTVKNPMVYIARLRKHLLQEKAVVVHAMQSIDALYARLATIGTSIKVVMTMHCFDFDISKTGLFINRIILPRTDRNFFVSYYQLDYYRNTYVLDFHKQQVIYNGISFDRIDTVKLSQKSIRKEFYIPEESLLLGMVGNFNSGRDHLTICRFLKLLDMKEVNFRLVFVGKRVEGQEFLYDDCVSYCLHKGISDKVFFVGSRQDVPDILKQLDAFVYSTAHDTFGIAVVEAMASGVPVFVNDWKVMDEISQHGRLATLYRTGDPQSLLDSFLGQQRDPEKNRGIAKEVRNMYSIEHHIAQLKECYDQLNLK